MAVELRKLWDYLAEPPPSQPQALKPLVALVIKFNPTMRVGTQQDCEAEGHYIDGTTRDITREVTWSSLPTDVVSIDAGGRASAHKQGIATIKAKAPPGSQLEVTEPIKVTK